MKLLLTLLLLTLPAVVQAQFIYTTNADNTITITGYTGSDDTVVIPDTINGYSVTSLGTNAFIGCTFITNISIPNSVVTIDDSAFWGCFGLTNVIVPDNVNSIGNWAFFDCVNINNVILGSNVKIIGIKAFSDCYQMTNINIPDGVTNIEDEAFWDCSDLANISIPANVVHIGEAAFYSCFSLRAISVDERSQKYSSVAGVLFDKNRTTLIEFPGGITGDYFIPDCVTNIAAFAFGRSVLSNVKIPDSVQTIGDDAFIQCGALTNIVIPNSVTFIGDSSFDDCPWLASITIGNGVTNIENYAFALNVNLTGIYFMGNAITNVGVNTFFSDNNTTVYYLPGTIGWNPTFADVPTAPWLLPYPTILDFEPDFLRQTNSFSFIISWATNAPVIVEACTSFSNPVWQPVQTNTLTDGSAYFSDPQWTNFPSRFYRLRSP